MKKYFLLSFFIYIFFFNHTHSHVNHYKKFKYLKYGLFLNSKLIGSHIFELETKNDLFYVSGKGSFKVNKLGVVLMNYSTNSEEIYKNGQLIKYNSKTIQNEKIKFANVTAKENKLYIDGSSYNGETDLNSLIGSWWNHEIIKSSKQISPISGRVIKQKVSFLGKEDIIIGDKKYNSLNFRFLSDDNKPLNKKKLNMNVWYDSKTFLWVKASYKKLGLWEYRLLEAR